MAELSNWTGKAYKIPRRLLKESRDRPELSKAGAYLLFGRDETRDDTSIVYVGEAENVFDRLKQHQEKDFWHEVVLFVSKDDNLNKAHVKFLEFQLYVAISRANRSRILNGNTPNCPVLSEPDQAVLTEFIDNAKLLVSALGYRALEPLIESTERHESPVFFTRSTTGGDASAVMTDEGFVVRTGSMARTDTTNTLHQYIRDLRQRLLESGVLKQQDQHLTFTADYVFSSPSTAGGVVLGRNVNGRTAWKDSSNRTLKEIEELA